MTVTLNCANVTVEQNCNTLQCAVWNTQKQTSFCIMVIDHSQEFPYLRPQWPLHSNVMNGQPLAKKTPGVWHPCVRYLLFIHMMCVYLLDVDWNPAVYLCYHMPCQKWCASVENENIITHNKHSVSDICLPFIVYVAEFDTIPLCMEKVIHICLGRSRFLHVTEVL